jgi:polyribonucleotide nucleotidyltransferase
VVEKLELDLGGRRLSIETGKVARQAHGAVTVRYGDTMVLSTVVATQEPRDVDFLPLMVEYRERTYAAGRIPGGFFKREGRPRDKEIVSARLTDRPIRPLFPKGFRSDIQVIITVLSADGENDADILGVLGASAALTISDVPYAGPIGAVRVGHVDGQWVLNPTFSELDRSALDLVVAGTDENIIMLQGGAEEVSEELVLGALDVAQRGIAELVGMQERLRESAGRPKRHFQPVETPKDLIARVDQLTAASMTEALTIADNVERQTALDDQQDKLVEQLAAEEWTEEQVREAFRESERALVRKAILDHGRRLDGRGPDDIREIACEVGLLPRTHGSALFSRGQTQCLAVTTLGTKTDEQKIDGLEGESWKSYMLHYNFPPFSVGEVRPIRGPGRREIGHGLLAERAIRPVIPTEERFPYTIRLVSDILESNGSSSMATVCAGSLSLMDAGVPVKAPVAGIALGLVKEIDRAVLLVDILGAEDHLGDMDLKVTGTREGITAIQMDLKTTGVPRDLFAAAFEKAKNARHYVLDEMAKALSAPRPSVSPFAPHIVVMRVKVSKIGEIIGPGGRTIRRIQEESGASIDIDDDGAVFISAPDETGAAKAAEAVRQLVEEAEIGKIYTGKVKKTVAFGAFVEILPGQEGLVHISELAPFRVSKVEDVVREGDEITVMVKGVDEQGKISLSRKAVPGMDETAPREREEPEEGKIYTGTVKKTMPYGAFVEILPGREGLLHLSQLAPYRVSQVEDIVKAGDQVTVMVTGIDERGKISLSRKAALDEEESS